MAAPGTDNNNFSITANTINFKMTMTAITTIVLHYLK